MYLLEGKAVEDRRCIGDSLSRWNCCRRHPRRCICLDEIGGVREGDGVPVTVPIIESDAVRVLVGDTDGGKNDADAVRVRVDDIEGVKDDDNVTVPVSILDAKLMVSKSVF